MLESVVIEVERAIKLKRDELPPIVILSPYDHSASIWSSKSFTSVIMRRLKGLAKSSSNILKLAPYEQISTELIHIFTPNVYDFHILIEIDQDKCNQVTNQLCDTSIHSNIYTHLINPAFDFYDKLKSFYSDVIHFFFDPFNPNCICGVFKELMDGVNFNVTNSLHRSPILTTSTSAIKGKCKIDLERLIYDIKIISNGMCTSVVYIKN
ncbi:hypothetical protein MXB_3288 [Myxobolus squamalis]|nr:hypothetical protein MXB_3288 [Myxobolus squamalis]